MPARLRSEPVGLIWLMRTVTLFPLVVGCECDGSTGSGNVSKKEWAALFSKLDTNGNGVIDREEWEAEFGPGSFGVWDSNGVQRI